MRRMGLLIALLCCLVVPAAAQEKRILRVETTIAGRITNRWGEPMTWPDGVQLVFFKFLGKRWDESLWARMTFSPNAAGQFSTTGTYPIDPGFTRLAMQKMDNHTVMRIDTGVQVLTADGRPVDCPNGVRIELSQFGAIPWPAGTTAKLAGHPDDLGRMWPKMELPINSTTRQNFSLLAEGRGK